MAIEVLILYEEIYLRKICSHMLAFICAQCSYASNIPEALLVVRSTTVDVLVVDFFDGSRWLQLYEAMENDPDIDVHALGMILRIPKITWGSAKQSNDFFNKVEARKVKLLMSPFPVEDLLVAVAVLAGKQGKLLLGPKEREACLLTEEQLCSAASF